MSELQRMEPAGTLENLAAEINAEHRACEAAAVSAVEHAIRAGELLSEVKSGLKHGEWLPWLEANFEGSRQTADVYRKLAANKGSLNCQRASNLSIRGALKELSAPAEEKPERKVFSRMYRPDGKGGLVVVATYYSKEEYAEARGYRISPPLLVDAEFNGLLPPLSDAEYAGLERAILQEGCRDVIIAWNNTILDGHARYEICVKHGIEYMVADVEMESREEAMTYILDRQLGRTNLSGVEVAYTRAKLEAERLARERGISEEEAWEEILGPE